MRTMQTRLCLAHTNENKNIFVPSDLGDRTEGKGEEEGNKNKQGVTRQRLL